MWIEQQSALYKLHDIINSTSDVPLHAEPCSQKTISCYWHEDDEQAQAANRTLPIPMHAEPDSKHPPVSP
jgi:hypothetical protein